MKAELKEFLRKLTKNLNILQEREAKYGGNAPLDLLSQIEDYQQAIFLTNQALAEQISQVELEEALKPLNLVEPGPTFREQVDRFLFGPDDDRARRNRQIMLTKVRDFWVEGVLENSLHGAAMIALGMEERPEAVAHPWEMVLHVPQEPERTLAKDTPIIEVFEQMREALLILGEPGSGKTTMLLALARDLIARAEQDPNCPLPVVFNLSSWAKKKQTIAEWLIEELNVKYTIPRKIAQPWVEQDQLLLLLDGLDEVALDHRDECVLAINNFRQESLVPVVVCSRIADYRTLTQRLNLNGAVLLQPLTFEQIETYLDQAGPAFEAVKQIFKEDMTFREIVQSPLILSITSLAYKELSPEQLQTFSTVEARRKHLFNTYIKVMLDRRKTKQSYSTKQTITCLIWLAQRLQQEAQTVFLIERIQPSWLLTRHGRWTYTITSRLIAGLIIGLIVGLLQVRFYGLSNGLISGLKTGLIFGMFGGLSISFIDILRGEWLEKRQEVKEIPVFWWTVINVMIVGLIGGLVGGLVGGLIWGMIWGMESGLSFGLSLGQIIGLIFGLIFGLRGSRQSLTNDIQTVEVLRWSWRRGLVISLITTLFAGLIFSLRMGLLDGLLNGLVVGFFGAVFGGLSQEIVQTKTIPNQGVWLSAKSAIFGGLAIGLIVGLFIVIIGTPVIGLGIALKRGLIFGLIFGLSSVLWCGGFDIIQHYTLRLILILQGYTPRQYVHFLDYAADCILLRKVGGGYIFTHRLLLEHFAAITHESRINGGIFWSQTQVDKITND